MECTEAGLGGGRGAIRDCLSSCTHLAVFTFGLASQGRRQARHHMKYFRVRLMTMLGEPVEPRAPRERYCASLHARQLLLHAKACLYVAHDTRWGLAHDGALSEREVGVQTYATSRTAGPAAGVTRSSFTSVPLGPSTMRMTSGTDLPATGCPFT